MTVQVGERPVMPCVTHAHRLAWEISLFDTGHPAQDWLADLWVAGTQWEHARLPWRRAFCPTADPLQGLIAYLNAYGWHPYCAKGPL